MHRFIPCLLTLFFDPIVYMCCVCMCMYVCACGRCGRYYDLFLGWPSYGSNGGRGPDGKMLWLIRRWKRYQRYPSYHSEDCLSSHRRTVKTPFLIHPIQLPLRHIGGEARGQDSFIVSSSCSGLQSLSPTMTIARL